MEPGSRCEAVSRPSPPGRKWDAGPGSAARSYRRVVRGSARPQGVELGTLGWRGRARTSNLRIQSPLSLVRPDGSNESGQVKLCVPRSDLWSSWVQRVCLGRVALTNRLTNRWRPTDDLDRTSGASPRPRRGRWAP